MAQGMYLCQLISPHHFPTIPHKELVKLWSYFGSFYQLIKYP